jgi:hypothetical protein
MTLLCLDAEGWRGSSIRRPTERETRRENVTPPKKIPLVAPPQAAGAHAFVQSFYDMILLRSQPGICRAPLRNEGEDSRGAASWDDAQRGGRGHCVAGGQAPPICLAPCICDKLRRAPAFHWEGGMIQGAGCLAAAPSPRVAPARRPIVHSMMAAPRTPSPTLYALSPHRW